jgi:hypothetical protein
MNYKPFRAQEIARALAPKCLKCAEPLKLQGPRVQAGSVVFPLSRRAQGWLCFRCEPGVTKDSVEKRRDAFLTAAHPHGPKMRDPHADQFLTKFMPWVPEPVPEGPLINWDEVAYA